MWAQESDDVEFPVCVHARRFSSKNLCQPTWGRGQRSGVKILAQVTGGCTGPMGVLVTPPLGFMLFTAILVGFHGFRYSEGKVSSREGGRRGSPPPPPNSSTPPSQTDPTSPPPPPKDIIMKSTLPLPWPYGHVICELPPPPPPPRLNS